MKKTSHIPRLLIVFFLMSPLLSFSQKIKGVNFRGPYDPFYEVDCVEGLLVSNADWVAMIPEATLDRSTLELFPDSLNKFWGETVEANIEGIRIAKSLGLKVMLKPHILLSETFQETTSPKDSSSNIRSSSSSADKTQGAKWRGDFVAKNESDWQFFERSYEEYILRLAQVSESMSVDLFCIGTELKKSAIKRPQFWKQLIQKVKSIYSGPITYSANWDEYNQITFWKDLDYIAVNSYFPISIAKTPKIKKTMRNWRFARRKLKRRSKREKKPILFTEFGYRNVDFAGTRPWLHDAEDNKNPNNLAQSNLYEAFFNSFWDKPWVAGGFCWQWFHNIPQEENTTFSIQDKPALRIIQQWYD